MSYYNIDDPYIYDLEIYKNLFLAGFHHIRSDKRFHLEFSPRKQERNELLTFLKTQPTLIGFNNLTYDYRLLEEFIRIMLKYPNTSTKNTVEYLKKKSDIIIGNRLGKPRNKPVIPQIDLFLIHHYDRLNCSLKHLEFAMRMENIQTLPYAYDAILTDEQIQNVVDYNDNDLDTTLKFYRKSIDEIKSRFDSSNIYKHDMMNMASPYMGETIFKIVLTKEYGTSEFGSTKHEYIDLKDIIFDYIKFETEPFNKILSFFKKQRVTELKGFFTEIPFEYLTELEGYYEVIKTKGTQKNLNIVFDDVTLVYGSGGIHGSVNREIIRSNSEYVILDLDVASFYPNLAIVNKFYPLHLGPKFCGIMKREYEERKLIPKSNPLNESKKRLINAVYGKSNAEYGIFRDTSYTLKTTINGQLLLSMLAENIITKTDSKLIQVNTDGISVLINRNDLDRAIEIYRSWESLTGLSLESVLYKEMFIRDCNNYIWVSEDGKIKRKGAYEWAPLLHKNHSCLVAPKAVEAYYLHNTPIEEFICNHTDIYDFMIMGKVNRIDKLIHRKEGEEDIQLQSLIRYFVSNEGKTLLKVMPPIITPDKEHLPKYEKFVADREKYIKKFTIRENNLEAGWLTTIANDLRGINPKDILEQINMSYYINEAKKLLVNSDDLNEINEEENDTE